MHPNEAEQLPAPADGRMDGRCPARRRLQTRGTAAVGATPALLGGCAAAPRGGMRRGRGLQAPERGPLCGARRRHAAGTALKCAVIC